MSDTQTETKLELLELTDIAPYEDSNDPNRRTHIINHPMNRHIWQNNFEMTAQEIVHIARLTAQPVVVLCGFQFVPKHNPEKFDTCDSCLKIAGSLIHQNGQ